MGELSDHFSAMVSLVTSTDSTEEDGVDTSV